MGQGIQLADITHILLVGLGLAGDVMHDIILWSVEISTGLQTPLTAPLHSHNDRIIHAVRDVLRGLWKRLTHQQPTSEFLIESLGIYLAG